MKNTPNWTRGSCIGKGSFGTVNLAVDKFNGEVFAVKSANTAAISFSEFLENEIQILKLLSSPYIVAYRGDDVTVENNSIVYKNLHMEYMPGGTVADVGKHGYDDVTIRSYTKCIVSALSYIHARNIVHCDVKGRNVLVGEIPRSAKLADFGSAIDLSCENKGIRGSPLWMAPEVVRGEYQGPESDVWSLGCTVIEMITGQPAWLDRGLDTLCQIGYSNDLPNLPACISDELRDFLDKCLRRDRSERWSCDKLLQHPYLLSCPSFSPKFGDKKWSPKSVFDWSDLNFSEEESQIENSDTSSTSSNAKQRIGKLCSNVAPNWESDGWEVVRTETVTTSQSSSPVNDLTITEREMICTPPVLLFTSQIHTSQMTMRETIVTFIVNLMVYKLTEPWLEFHDWKDNNDEESTIDESERTKREYGDSNGNFFHDDHQCINNNAKSTSSSWSSRDIDNYYSCYVCLSLDKLLLLLFNLNVTRHIYYKILFVFVFKSIYDLVSVLYFRINFLPTFYFSEDMKYIL